jgi:hypothetical protein
MMEEKTNKQEMWKPLEASSNKAYTRVTLQTALMSKKTDSLLEIPGRNPAMSLDFIPVRQESLLTYRTVS